MALWVVAYYTPRTGRATLASIWSAGGDLEPAVEPESPHADSTSGIVRRLFGNPALLSAADRALLQTLCWWRLEPSTIAAAEPEVSGRVVGVFRHPFRGGSVAARWFTQSTAGDAPAPAPAGETFIPTYRRRKR